MKPKVSIIVPVYNVEKYLARCMESLLNQTLTEIEIILVDDGSPDNCPQMCDEYAKRDSRVKVIHKSNAGLGYARNSGLDVAIGEYIAFVELDRLLNNQLSDMADSQPRTDRLFIGNVRSFLLHLYSTNLANKIFYVRGICNDDIWVGIQKRYKLSYLPVYQRIIYYFIIHKNVYLLANFCKLANYIKRRKGMR